MLEPTVPLGDTECTLGCTSVVPVPDIAPTGFAMIELVFALILLCRILSTVFSINTNFFFIPSFCAAVFLLGEFDRVCVWFFEFKSLRPALFLVIV